MPYIGRSTEAFGVRTRYTYTPSAGDTSVSGADVNGLSLSFTDGAYVDVFLNGVRLKHNTDYVTTTANTIGSLAALAASDEVEVVVFDVFSLADMVSKANGGKFEGRVDFNGGVGGSGGALTLKNTDTSDDSFPVITLQTGDTDIAQSDVLGRILFQAPDEGTGTDAITSSARIQALSEGDFSSSNNATSIEFRTATSGVVGTAAQGSRLTLQSDANLLLKDMDTADGSSPTITLQTGDTDIAQDDVLGTINFQAPDEGTGTDAILVAAGISAISEGDFSSSSNATKLSFKTGSSEAASEKMSLSSAGLLTVSGRIITDDTTDATSTTDGSLQTDGGLSVAKDTVIGDDLLLKSDNAVIHFGADSEITLTHVPDAGLILKHAATADGKRPRLTLSAGDTDIAQDDELGVVSFQAPDEGAGTDAILIGAEIAAVSEGDFSASSNATKLSFRTAASEEASASTEKMSIASDGHTTITTAGNTNTLSLVSTDADANEGPILRLMRDSSSPADGDSLGRIYFSGDNDAGEETQFVRFQSILDDASDGTEDSSFRIQTYVGGALKSKIFSTAAETTLNDDGASHNFRVEAATSTHALFVKGDDSNIGIGTDTPDRMGSANTRGVVTIASNSYAVFELVNGDSDGDGNVNTINFIFDNNTAANSGQTVLLRGFTDGTTAGHRGGRFSIFTKNNNASGLNEHFRIDKAGNITATDTSIGSISDERLKTNMEDFTYSIDDFKKYKPKKYDWKHPEVHGGKSDQWGFSAQDVEKIDARFVDEYRVENTEGIKDNDGNQIVHPDRQYLDADDIAKSSKLQQKDAMYISVIQQLITRIEALESK